MVPQLIEICVYCVIDFAVEVAIAINWVGPRNGLSVSLEGVGIGHTVGDIDERADGSADGVDGRGVYEQEVLTLRAFRCVVATNIGVEMCGAAIADVRDWAAAWADYRC